MNFIGPILDSFSPVDLKEIDSIRLMDRTDLKFVTPVQKIPDLLDGINGFYNILEINNKKSFRYNTVYLDTPDFDFFNQHVTRKPERIKVRFRKYDTGISYLEVKKKSRNRSVKWRIENTLSNDSACDAKGLAFLKQHLADADLLGPVLGNSFYRITLAGKDFMERLTIDYDLAFSDLNGGHVCFPFIAVVEIKRDSFSDRSPVQSVLRSSGVHPSGFSKYCIGAASLYEIPRRHILMPKFQMIKKIENENNGCIAV